MFSRRSCRRNSWMWNDTLLFKNKGQGTWSKSTARPTFTFNKIVNHELSLGKFRVDSVPGKVLKLEGMHWPKYHPAELGLFRAVQGSTKVKWFGSRDIRLA